VQIPSSQRANFDGGETRIVQHALEVGELEMAVAMEMIEQAAPAPRGL